VEVTADGAQLVELLQNLVHNALDAVGRDGTVELVASRADGAVELRVRDSGPGLDPALRARLFVPFSSTKPHGTGLGLVMCRMIAANHGGELEAEEVERGASFVVRLPQPPRPAPSRA
jgi:signal transduction histidine kinase